MSKLVFFKDTLSCWNLPIGRLNFFKFPVKHECLLKSPLTVTWRDWDKFADSTGSTAHTKTHIPTSRCTGGWNSIHVSWYMMLDHTISIEKFLFVYGYLISCYKGKESRMDVLCHHGADVIPPPFSDTSFLVLLVHIIYHHIQRLCKRLFRDMAWSTPVCMSGNRTAAYKPNWNPKTGLVTNYGTRAPLDQSPRGSPICQEVWQKSHHLYSFGSTSDNYTPITAVKLLLGSNSTQLWSYKQSC